VRHATSTFADRIDAKMFVTPGDHEGYD